MTSNRWEGGWRGVTAGQRVVATKTESAERNGEDGDRQGKERLEVNEWKGCAAPKANGMMTRRVIALKGAHKAEARPFDVARRTARSACLFPAWPSL
jgi:hypothetical protein